MTDPDTDDADKTQPTAPRPEDARPAPAPPAQASAAEGPPAPAQAAPAAAPPEPEPVCPHCRKPLSLCVCEGVEPIENRVALLILQHPQEQDKLLGTARLAARHFTNAVFKVGLSWPSLEKALGRPADPRRWAILHLGSVDPATLPRGRDIAVVDSKGIPAPDQDTALKGIDGIVVFDGTWSQAKTLWWRNPWVLKGKRLVLAPTKPSLYGRLRREPRREGLSTLEAAALVLSRLEKQPEIETRLLDSFGRMLDRYRDSGLGAAPAKPDRRGRRPFRRRKS
ncbi:DTW domain-containing protein [Alsobacter sp. SYSU M60028]|uniref:tRNA-uridine aminocarboxypropyltransferase n=1 Tax=Alsobacter ponti TaxID=2962936 RepID=A0ABT1LCV2_9HYPH|nr:DTW domain-containing protein [Alsobacter ponti]